MYTLHGKPDQHVTCIPRLIRVWSQTIHISHGQRIATFRVVIKRVEQGHYSREKGLPTQSTARRVIDPRVCTQFLSQDSHWISGGQSQSSVYGQLLGFLGPYHRHVIGTFNTCSWGTTHLSLTDTGGGYNHLRALPDLRLSNLNISIKRKWCETSIADPWSFDHSASTKAYVYV
jgi:hypothetical protein